MVLRDENKEAPGLGFHSRHGDVDRFLERAFGEEFQAFYDRWYDKADILQYQRFVSLAPAEIVPDAVPKTDFCGMPFGTMQIKASGAQLFSCCGQFHAFHRLGTFPETGLKDAWNSDAGRSLRQRLRSGDIPASCRTCLSL